MTIKKIKDCYSCLIKMPEGPEVKTVTDSLNKSLTGRMLYSVNWDTNSKFAKDNNGPPGYGIYKQSFPCTIKGVICKGKQIFFILESNTFKKIFYMNSTLGMEGRWSWTQGNHSNLWLELSSKKIITLNIIKKTISPIKSNSVSISPIKGSSVITPIKSNNGNDSKLIAPPGGIVVTNEESKNIILYFDDSRHFGNISFLDEIGFNHKLGELGMDLLTEDVTLTDWLKITQRPRLSKKPISEFLMEQKYFCGIGAYLNAEILYRSRISPARQLGQLSNTELSVILTTSLTTIRSSYKYGGLTVRSYWDPEGRKGTFPVFIYGKQCDHLGNKVEKIAIKGERNICWVPAVQL